MSTPAVSAREIVSSRVFPATRERLFEAFSDPDQLMHWWGPKGFTNTFEKFDPFPGGEWIFTMHAPTGAEYHNAVEFIEVTKPDRIIFVHQRPVHRFEMTMLFRKEGSGTRLTWHMVFDSADEVARLRDFITQANEENFDRLSDHLANPNHTPHVFPT